LEIKRDTIADYAKVANVQIELAILKAACDNAIDGGLELSAQLMSEIAFLKRTNERIYAGIAEQAAFHVDGVFGNGYVMSSRFVLEQNSIRATVKRRINELCQSRLVEEKSFGV
jgi:hypothetical protein